MRRHQRHQRFMMLGTQNCRSYFDGQRWRAQAVFIRGVLQDPGKHAEANNGGVVCRQPDLPMFSQMAEGLQQTAPEASGVV